MALEHIGKSLRFHWENTYEEYLEKRRKILASLDPEIERIVDGIIYCRKCHYPKSLDDSEHWAAIRCSCKCEVDAWEREKNPPRNFIGVKRVYAGDYNPFDGA